ncbi:MAG TPA: 2-C-methyl-D-erythritol 4-phosphate cytidylyltransferase, partial [Vibrio sp.]|nr:2-C-methyl-D-erythritol 4-phosphate cytidylyltransferase [Vibrio sp.]
MSNNTSHSIVAIVPAAGIGSRMKADKPKQYLMIGGRTVLEHTLLKLLAHPRVNKVVVAISDGDPYFSELAIATHPDIVR